MFVSRWSLHKKTAKTRGGGTDKTDKTPSGALFLSKTRGGVTDKADKTPHTLGGPPPEVRLTPLCPNPACMPVIVQANQFMHECLAGQLAADSTPLFTSVAYQANRDALIAALAEGDLEATKTVCRAWCQRVVGWTQQHRAHDAARRLAGLVA